MTFCLTKAKEFLLPWRLRVHL